MKRFKRILILIIALILFAGTSYLICTMSTGDSRSPALIALEKKEYLQAAGIFTGSTNI